MDGARNFSTYLALPLLCHVLSLLLQPYAFLGTLTGTSTRPLAYLGLGVSFVSWSLRVLVSVICLGRKAIHALWP